jgi:uncharacterized protein (DUF952 family)
MPEQPIFHMCPRIDWEMASAEGTYAGGSDDRRDGFIHFSTAEQVVESATKHRAGQDGLVLLTVDAMALGSDLKWERSRGDALFPHLYGTVPPSAVLRVDDLPLGDDGLHVFPAHVVGADA